MKNIIRLQFRGAIREDAGAAALEAAFRSCGEILREKKTAGTLYTAGLFRHEDMLFLHLELIGEGEAGAFRRLPETWLTPLEPLLKRWPEMDGDSPWAYMLPVFWFDIPKSVETFARRQPPESRCGRIAVLRPEKAMSYICHHQAIAAEGLLLGDRYQFISVHENLLFSYFETPRDREWVNVKREEGASREIVRWTEADPDSHFHRFPQAPDENFLVIETAADV